MTAPALVPAGWELVSVGTSARAITRAYPDGLAALYSIDIYETIEPGSALAPGRWRHLSLSRRNRYPDWDEMRDVIQRCGLFDRDLDVVMILPPKDRYVNVQKNCFHWYQRADRPRRGE